MEANDMKAMREALLALKELDFNKEEDCYAFYRIIDEALAAPPRNCDRFDDLYSAQRYYIEHGCPKGLGMLVDGEIRKVPWKSQFEKWLFAKTTEQR